VLRKRHHRLPASPLHWLKILKHDSGRGVPGMTRTAHRA
jgi:hypothetical protein